jgi:hypothetical protein
VLPPTRTHYQLAELIERMKLVTYDGLAVEAEAQQWTTSTDRVYNKIRFPGKGRKGTRLTLRTFTEGEGFHTILDHKGSEWGRTHSEAREWVRLHLRTEWIRGR